MREEGTEQLTREPSLKETCRKCTRKAYGRRGREQLQNLTKESIVTKTDDTGQEYVMLDYNELDKSHQLQKPNENEKQIMFSQSESDDCPIKSYKKYTLISPNFL